MLQVHFNRNSINQSSCMYMKLWECLFKIGDTFMNTYKDICYYNKTLLKIL